MLTLYQMNNVCDVQVFKNSCPCYSQAYPVMVSSMFPKTNARAHVCKVTTTWFGFYRIWRGSNQIFDTVDLALPPYSYESQVNLSRVKKIYFDDFLFNYPYMTCFNVSMFFASE